ncbi:MAG: UDP-galactopyranose mutase, partial [Burkholderiales bacterium]|nr:UDP-galactopyranose mutase [Burkholderiales bacterium]
NKDVWEYVNQFADFNNFINSPIARYKDKLYNLPFNMNTFYELWGTITPKEAQEKIEAQKKEFFASSGDGKTPRITNLEEQAISLVGKDIYEILIKGYTEKQWGRDCKDLPPSIIKRLPVRFTFDNNYFNDRYQGIPIEGYTALVQKLLEGIEVKCNVNFLDDRHGLGSLASKIVYTGCIDEFFEYQLGTLQYRSLRFKSENLDCPNYQGVAVVNYNEREIPYTRIIEHKHFVFGKQQNTVITHEYPQEWARGTEPYYPVNNEKNNELYEKYVELSKLHPSVIFGGRLGMYKYFDMDKVIEVAMNCWKAQQSE